MSASVWNGVNSNLTTDADNFTPSGVPDETVDLSVTVAAPDDVDGNLTVKNLDFTGFTGAYTRTLGSATIHTYGDVTFSAGMSIGVDTELDTFADSTITMAGLNLGAFGGNGEFNIFGDASTVTLADNFYHTGYFECDGNDATIALGTHTLTVKIVASNDGNGLFLTEGNGNVIMSHGSGGKLVLIADTGVLDFECYFPLAASGTLPPTEMSGAGNFNLYDNGPKLTSLLITNTTVDGSNLSTPINVVGSNVATGSTISNCDFSDGTELDATDSCVDGGGNTNVNFGTPDVTAPYITNIDGVDGDYVTAQTIDITCTMSENVTKTGSVRLALRLFNGIKYANYLSGSGTDTFVFRYTVAAPDATDDLQAYAIDLNGGTMVDGASNPISLEVPTEGLAGSLSFNSAITIFNGNDTVAPRPNHRRLGMLR